MVAKPKPQITHNSILLWKLLFNNGLGFKHQSKEKLGDTELDPVINYIFVFPLIIQLRSPHQRGHYTLWQAARCW